MKKKAKHFKQHKVGRGGWSEWVFPIGGYLFKCCDCGLVHEFQFKTFVERARKGKVFNAVELPQEVRSMFRARRYNNENT